MALNGTQLKDAIITAFNTSGIFDVTGWTTPNYFDEFIEIISNEIVAHITANAVVTTTSGAPDGEHTGNIT
jgi:hypothetical protein